MPLENRISAQIDPNAIEKIADDIKSIKSQLPFLQNLTLDDRKSLPKMGDKTLSFVSKSLEYALQNPQVVPAFLDVTEFRKDVELTNNLLKVLMPLQQLLETVDDSTMLAGSEAYAAALVFYNSVKAAAKAGVPGMKSIVDDLSTRFPGRTPQTAAVTNARVSTN